MGRDTQASRHEGGAGVEPSRSPGSPLTVEQLDADFPEPVGRQTIRTEEFLIHLATHLAYHLGQIDYHRRIVTGEAGQVGAIPVNELHTARAT